MVKVGMWRVVAGVSLFGLGLAGCGGSKSADSGAGGDSSKGGDSAQGGASSGGTSSSGGAASGGSASGGAATGGASASGGATGTGGAGAGDKTWACVEAGGSCICDDDAQPDSTDPKACTGTYPCCFTAHLGPVTRCQCQDPGGSACSDLAAYLGGEVFETCPPP